MDYRTYTHEELTLSELFSTLAGQIRQLFRQEVQLAQVEMTQKATRAGRHAAYIGAGAMLGMGAFYAILAAVILLLSQVMSPWLAALVVGLVLAAAAALLVRYGIEKLRNMELAPRQTLESVRESREWLTEQI